MKTNLLSITMVAVIAVGATALPVHADDWHKRKNSKYKKDTRVTVNVISDRGHYHRGPAPRPVYVAPRPVYVAPRPVYVERPGYGRSVEIDVQRALARRGYYGGVIDGDIGPRSRASIRAYQVDKGLPVTGRIDGSLLRSLRLL